jgi:MoxR-like ATPase
LSEILNRTTAGVEAEVSAVLDSARLLEHQALVRQVAIAPHVQDYAVRLVLATHPEGQYAAGGAGGPTNKYVRCGASPRAAQALLLGGKVKALTDGRYHVSYKDVKDVALLALRHRLILNFEAEADRIDPDGIVRQILELTPTEPVKERAMA